MRTIIFKGAIILTIVVFISFFIIQGMIILEGSRTSLESVDYLIILGARLYGDRPSPALLERLKVSEDYLLVNKDVKVVVSGGQGSNEDISEAHAMEKYLLSKGIEKERIIIEDKSTNTFENLTLSLDEIRKIEKKDKINVLIATNKYHIFRAKLLGKRLGLQAYGLPAKIPPSIIVQSYVREYFAVIKSFFFDKL